MQRGMSYRHEYAVTSLIDMRAAILEACRAPFRLARISRPEPGLDEVLVRIDASGVNPLDPKIHVGEAAHARHPLPAILGLDLAGTVEAVGAGVTRFRGGDAVYGMTGGLPGSLAEFAAVDPTSWHRSLPTSHARGRRALPGARRQRAQRTVRVRRRLDMGKDARDGHDHHQGRHRNLL